MNREYWTPTEFWKDQDVFIVGGGPSLKGFEFSRLQGKNVIGCNSAALLIEKIVDVLLFSDIDWYFQNKTRLSKFQKLLITQNEGLYCYSRQEEIIPNLKFMRREMDGLHKEALGFGGNTGCSAVNLALILGASRVFLLGIDCCGGIRNEHHFFGDEERAHESEALYMKFREGFQAIWSDLPKVFPDRKIYNCNPSSSMRFFEFMPVEVALGEQNPGNRKETA